MDNNSTTNVSIQEENISYNNQSEKQNTEQENTNTWKFYLPKIGMLICLIYIVQDIFTHEAFYEKSADFTIAVQKDNSTSLINFMKFVSISCLILMGAILIAYIVITKHRQDIYSIIVYFCTSIYFMNILKLFYNDPRPFMSYSKIHAFECATEYGNPSGHAMLNLLGYLLFPYIFDKKFYTFKNNRTDQLSIQKIVIFIVSVIWILLIGFSRVYLGVHSLNQVILGFMYGIFLTIFYIDIANEYLNTTIVQSITLPKANKIQLLLKVSIVFLTLTALSLITFLIVEGSTSHSQNKEYQNMILQKCSSKYTHSDDFEVKFLYNKCLVDSGALAGAFGVLLGILLSKGSYRGEEVFYHHFNDTPIVKIILRTLVIGIPSFLPYAILMICQLFIFPDSVYLKYIVFLNIGLFLAAFIFTFVSPILLQKFNLEINGDFLQLKPAYKTQTLLNDGDQSEKEVLSIKTSVQDDQKVSLNNQNYVTEELSKLTDNSQNQL